MPGAPRPEARAADYRVARGSALPVRIASLQGVVAGQVTERDRHVRVRRAELPLPDRERPQADRDRLGEAPLLGGDDGEGVQGSRHTQILRIDALDFRKALRRAASANRSSCVAVSAARMRLSQSDVGCADVSATIKRQIPATTEMTMPVVPWYSVPRGRVMVMRRR